MWDTGADDGSADWMSKNAGLNFDSKNHLFKNMVYTIRRTKEALTNGGVPFEWAGIVWVQGQADLQAGGWNVFGTNTARVWEGFRLHMGTDAPIIDTGSSTHNKLKSGKVYATQIVKGCKAKNVEFALAANDDTSTDCQPGPSNICADAPNMHLNLAPFNHFGYDPFFPEESKNCGSSCKEFKWYRQYPTNIHSGYEGMILKGRVLANAFLTEFVPSASNDFLDEDVATLFPWDPCPAGTLPSDGNYCWIDYRDADVVNSSELCTIGGGGSGSDGSSGGNNGDTGNDGNGDSGAASGNLKKLFLAIVALVTAFGIMSL